MDTKTRYIGTCPVCTGEFKLKNDRKTGSKVLVHHGYLRPGDGMIHGDCFCVGYEPYERSPKGCEAWRFYAMERRETLEKYLAKLTACDVRRLTDINVTKSGKIEHIDFIVGVTNLEIFRRRYDYERSNIQRQITHCEAEITRMDRLIECWTLKDLMTVEEAAARPDPEKEARQAEKAAKKKAQQEKRAQLDAKKLGREEERKALIGRLR